MKTMIVQKSMERIALQITAKPKNAQLLGSVPTDKFADRTGQDCAYVS